MFPLIIGRLHKNGHELVLLSDRIDWGYFEKEFRRYYSNTGQPFGISRRPWASQKSADTETDRQGQSLQLLVSQKERYIDNIISATRWALSQPLRNLSLKP